MRLFGISYVRVLRNISSVAHFSHDLYFFRKVIDIQIGELGNGPAEKDDPIVSDPLNLTWIMPAEGTDFEPRIAGPLRPAILFWRG